MLETLSEAFGGTDGVAPSVYAPKKLQGYATNRADAKIEDEFLLDYWTVGFPADKHLGDADIVKCFKAKYPGEKTVNWAKSLPGAKRHEETYDGEHDLKFTVAPTPLGKDEEDVDQHIRFLKAQGHHWKVAKAYRNVIPADDGVTETLQFGYEFVDGGGNSWEETGRSIVPRTAKEKEALARHVAGKHFGEFSWDVVVPPHKGKLGHRETVTAKVTGKRTVVRIQRELHDDQGQRMDPSREDGTYYGKYVP